MIELCCEYLSVQCISVYVVIMSHTSLRVNPHSIACLNVKELLALSRLHIWSLGDSNKIQNHNYLVCKRKRNHLAKLAKCLTCVVGTSVQCIWVCYYHVTHKFQSEFTLYSVPVWLNGWVFIYELSGCGFESRCCHFNFKYGACFEQGVPWHSGKL